MSSATVLTNEELVEALEPDIPAAFPMVIQTVQGAVASRGMTLRDWFAGQALAGLSAKNHAGGVSIAKSAYALADAMLAERGRQA